MRIRWTGAGVLALTLTVGATGAVSARPWQARGDWPRFRGPTGDGHGAAARLRTDWSSRPPALLWKLAMGDDGYAGPSVSDGLLYIVDHAGDRDIVRAIRMSDGSGVWRFEYPEESRSVYGFARSTPTVDSGRVFVQSRSGVLHCLEARTGRMIWRRDMVAELGGRSPMWKYSASPLIDRGRLIVWPGGARSSIAALDPSTGRKLWTGGDGDVAGYGTPVAATIGGRRMLVMTVWNGFVGVRDTDGALVWRFPWPARDGCNCASPVVLPGGRVFITASYDTGSALLDVSGPEPTAVWRSTEMKAHFSTPILHDGFLYGASDPGSLVCLDPNTGASRWRAPGFEKGGAVIVGDLLIALCGSTGDAVMVRATPDRYEELGRFTPLGGQSWTAPIVAGGRLIVRNRQTLACFSLE